ncbi:MAG: hypothetical protein HY904_20775 [Deltaproteobacteria bacterium]|nr:hypothetical protein [Deltaproteobacteria bacterium]
MTNGKGKNARPGPTSTAQEILSALVDREGATAVTEALGRVLAERRAGAPSARAEQVAHHIRAGEPRRARRELGPRWRDAISDDPEVTVGHAELATLRGDMQLARHLLWSVAHVDSPGLQARRRIALALSYFLEDRHDRSLAAARLASQEPLFTEIAQAVEAMSLIGLGRIDRAEAMLAAAGRTRTGLLAAVGACAAYRRGDLLACLDEHKTTLDVLSNEGDLVARSVLARPLAWAAMRLGRFDEAEVFLQAEETTCGQTGLPALAPLLDADRAELAAARGHLPEARERVRRALAASPNSPDVRINAWALGEPVPPPHCGPAAVHAWGDLKAAEHALETGHRSEAATRAQTAAQWYREVGAWYEVARAQLASAEANAWEAPLDAGLALAECERIAETRGYGPIRVGASLVRASIADRGGDLAGYRQAMEQALARAGTAVDRSLASACSRCGVPAGSALGTDCPWRSRVQRLGLDRPATDVWTLGPRVHLLSAGEAAPVPVDIEVDRARNVIVIGGCAHASTPQRQQLLALFGRAGQGGVSLEEIHRAVGPGCVYHPLRHRDALYVAVARLRAWVEPLVHAPVLARDPTGYRVVNGVRVAVREPNCAVPP